MSILSVDLNTVNLDYVNFDEDDRLNYVNFDEDDCQTIVRCKNANYVKNITQINPVAWYPTR